MTEIIAPLARTYANTLAQFDTMSLDDHPDQPAFRLKIREFKDGSVDYIVTRTGKLIDREPLVYGLPRLKKTPEQIAAAKEENLERSARRAKQKVGHLVRSIGADHMLTLTVRENIIDNDQFDMCFKRFVRLVRTKHVVTKRVKSVNPDGTYTGEIVTHKSLQTNDQQQNWQYVAVREYQERGANHMHIACVGRQNLELLRACWYVALGGDPNDSGSNTLGQVDVRFNKKRFSGETEIFKTFKLVSYLTKYIAKSFTAIEELNVRRYKASQCIDQPKVTRQFLNVYYSDGNKDFIQAMTTTINIANFHGITDMELWNRGIDVFIIKGYLQ